MSGSTSYHAGLAAEDQVADFYRRSGCDVTHRRWRGQGGEIDLVARDGDNVVFVEVKKSRDFARAAESLSLRQMKWICNQRMSCPFKQDNLMILVSCRIIMEHTNGTYAT